MRESKGIVSFNFYPLILSFHPTRGYRGPRGRRDLRFNPTTIFNDKIHIKIVYPSPKGEGFTDPQ